MAVDDGRSDLPLKPADTPQADRLHRFAHDLRNRLAGMQEVMRMLPADDPDGAEALKRVAQALELAKPYLAGTPLEDPAVMQLIKDQILPIAPAADLNVQITVE